jgi:hypothetical protein
MTCELPVDIDSITEYIWFRLHHGEFDFNQFVADLICVSDDGINFLMWTRESRIDRIIREGDMYAWNVTFEEVMEYITTMKYIQNRNILKIKRAGEKPRE